MDTAHRKTVLRNNVDVNAAIFSRHGWTALEIARSLGQTEMVVDLVRYGALDNPTPRRERFIVEAYHAFHNRDIKVIQDLINKHKVDHLDLLDLT